jgi:hypothetical protein
MSMLLRSRLLGGLSSFALFAPEGGGGGAPVAPAPAAPAAAAPAASEVAATPAPASPAAPAAPAAAGGGTIAGGGGAPPQIAVQGKWPDNWRDEFAEALKPGDTKFRERLNRFAAPTDVGKSWLELDGKVSAGELKAPAKPLAADAKPEEVAAWRKDQGLPEKPEAMVAALKLPGGLVPGEADKPLLEAFAKDAFAANMDQATFDRVTGWYFNQQAEIVQQRQQADARFEREALVTLAQEWGPTKFEQNRGAVANLVNLLPENVRDALMTARLPNGNIAGNDPAVNNALLMLSNMINPASTLLPNIAGGGLSGVESRIAEIETKHMRAPQGTPEWQQYWTGDAGAKMQGEYRELLSARETMQTRAKNAA